MIWTIERIAHRSRAFDGSLAVAAGKSKGTPIKVTNPATGQTYTVYNLYGNGGDAGGKRQEAQTIAAIKEAMFRDTAGTTQWNALTSSLGVGQKQAGTATPEQTAAVMRNYMSVFGNSSEQAGRIAQWMLQYTNPTVVRTPSGLMVQVQQTNPGEPGHIGSLPTWAFAGKPYEVKIDSNSTMDNPTNDNTWFGYHPRGASPGAYLPQGADRQMAESLGITPAHLNYSWDYGGFLNQSGLGNNAGLLTTFAAPAIAPASAALSQSLSNATGLSPTASTAIVKGGIGAAQNALTSGGNPLAIVKGGLTPATNAIIDTGFQWGSDNMDGDIFDSGHELYAGDDFGYNNDLYINPAGSAGGSDFDWSAIVKAGLAGGMSLAGAIAAANAQAGAAGAASNASTAAANTAANATLQGTREAIAAQERMYQQNRQDFAPFAAVGPEALATLQSLTYGRPVQYTPVGGTTQQSGGLANLYTTGSDAYGGLTSQQILEMVTGKAPNPKGYTIADALKAAKSNPVYTASGGTGGTATANAQQFDLAGLSAQQTSALQNFKPEGTAAYEWQKKQGLDDLRTQLMMMGRPSGTVAANANSKFLGNLNANEYDKGYQRLSALNDLNYNRLVGQKTDYENNLLNLIKTAQGAAQSTSAAGQNFANASSSALQNQGNNLATIATNNGTNQANASLVKGASTANLYSGLSQLPFSLANLANQNGYKLF